MGARTERAKWFLPTWSVAKPRYAFALLLGTFLPINDWLFGNDHSTLEGALWGSGITAALVLTAAVLNLGVRASSRGIHSLVDGVVRWDQIVNAVREGPVIRYDATIGSGGKAVARKLASSPKLANDVCQWVAPEHPLRKALETVPPG